MKKIIFFDGDGTLWAPKHPKYQEPWHIYLDEEANPFDGCRPEPGAIKTLGLLKDLGIMRILLSTSPLSSEEAINHRTKMVHSMGMTNLIDDIQVSPEYPEGKGERILELLSSYNIKKQYALMVGDMYKWDYKPAQDIGVDALLKEKNYSYKYFEGVSGLKTIKQLSEVLEYI